MTDKPAGVGPVEHTVRPVAEVRCARLCWHLPTPDADPVAKFLDNERHLLYDQDALDAAVAEERERRETALRNAERERDDYKADYLRLLREKQARMLTGA